MKLKAWLEWQEMTYREFGEKVGISRSFAFKIAAGAHFPKAATILKIQKLTEGQVSADDLLRENQKYGH